jgi:hypothetical protein
MSSGKPTEERRGGTCETCIKDDFGTVKKLVFMILAASVISGGGGLFAAYAGSEKNSEQDSRITAVETNQVNVLKQLDSQSIKLDKLIELNTVTVIQLNELKAKTEGE